MVTTAKRAGLGLLLLATLAVAWVSLVGPINFTTADLGRHLRNGELALDQHQVIRTNRYSYTQPDYPTICHHWGAGVLFYLAWKATGFTGLSVLYGGMLLLTLGIFAGMARRASSTPIALLAAMLSLPLLAFRTEIRPEGFTTLFLAVEFLLLSLHREGRLGDRWPWVLPGLQLLWVNLHILFITGLALQAIFTLDALVMEGRGPRFRRLAVITLASAAASLANPFGLAGFLAPMNILREYGYNLAENQPLLSMLRRVPGPSVYRYGALVMLATVLLCTARAWRGRSWRRAFLDLALLGFFAVLALRTARAMAMFGFFFVPLAAAGWQGVAVTLRSRVRINLDRFTLGAAVLVVLLAATVPGFGLSPLGKFASAAAAAAAGGAGSTARPGPASAPTLPAVLFRPASWAGLPPGVNRSAEFFRMAGLVGPVFNNYDLGAYLIFHLFPRERVFVDNRPEAYPVDFFQREYLPMQADEETWNRLDAKYGFQAIYFERHDQTARARTFLVHRLGDPRWAPVFLDDYTVILAKRGGPNQAAIERYPLPPGTFARKRD